MDNAIKKRSTDSEDKVRFRSDRVICQNGLFYFTTREGLTQGPYRNREKAEDAAITYVRRQARGA